MSRKKRNFEKPILKVGLLSCAKRKKRADKAKNLYVSDHFKKAREYAERCYDKWYILSAKHHLLDPDKKIHPYDETLTTKTLGEMRKWSEAVFSQIRREIPDPRSCRLFIHAGEKYRRNLIALLTNEGYECHVPLRKLGIGKQMAWYNEYNKEKKCHF